MSSEVSMRDMSADEVDIESQEVVRPQRSCCGRLCGRIFKDKTQYACCIVSGAGAAIVSYSIFFKLGTLATLGGSGVILVGGLITCCAVSYYKPEKALEDRVKDFNKANKNLTEQIAILSSEIEELKKIRDELEATLEKAEGSVKKLNKTLGKKVSDLKDVAKKLQATEEKLQVLEKLLINFKKGMKQFASDLNKFNKVNKVFKSNVGGLSGEVDGLDKVEDELSDELGEFNDSNEFFEKQNKQFEGMLKGLTDNVGSLQERFSEMKQSLIELKTHTLKLDEVDDKFLDGATKLEKVAPELENLLKRYTEFFDEVDDTEDSSSIGGTELYEDLSGEDENND